jgi:hypothetical protein
MSKDKVVVDLPKMRNPVVQGMIERSWGAGKHKNPQDYARGHARHPKHKGRDHMEAATDLDKEARFHEGPEGREEWEEWFAEQPQEFQEEWESNTEEYGDQFKAAGWEGYDTKIAGLSKSHEKILQGYMEDVARHAGVRMAKGWDELPDSVRSKLRAVKDSPTLGRDVDGWFHVNAPKSSRLAGIEDGWIAWVEDKEGSMIHFAGPFNTSSQAKAKMNDSKWSDAIDAGGKMTWIPVAKASREGFAGSNTKPSAAWFSKLRGQDKHKLEAFLQLAPWKKNAGLEDACWDGYEAIGVKTVDGKEVPNCVPVKTAGNKSWSRMFRPGTYLNTFFSEKDIPIKSFRVKDSKGLEHIIDNDVVVEAIAQTSGQERKKIEDTLRKIDFANGDVNRFLEHLAKGLAEQYSGVMRGASKKTATPSTEEELLELVEADADPESHDQNLASTWEKTASVGYIGSATQSEFKALEDEINKHIKNTGEVVAIRWDGPKGYGDWSVVLSTEYAALRLFYAYRMSDPKLTKAPGGWSVRV